MTITSEQAQTIQGGKVYASDGAKIGSVGQVYLDDTTGEPSWVTAKTGLFGTSESFVPLQGATLNGDDISVGYDEATIKGAPRVDPDSHLDPEEENQLYRYYQLDGVGSVDNDRTDYDRTNVVGDGVTNDVVNDGVVDDDVNDGVVGHDTSGPTTDNAMTRSEEQLTVGTAQREAGRARLRKYVTSETVTETVPVSREEVTVHREPITDANVGDATAGPAISEEEHEVVLHEEVPVVEKTAVPVERVQLDKETVTEQATVSEEVRKEQIEVNGADDNVVNDNVVDDNARR